MNYLWGGMILVGILYGMLTGRLQQVSEAAINSSKEAVSLCIVMAGVTALWVGMMRIAENCGLLEAMERRLEPILGFLFPRIPKEHPARKSITTNLVANVLGLGWAATPAGLKAMEELEALEEERREMQDGLEKQEWDEKKTGILQMKNRKKFRVQEKGTASDEMCDFLILNISSLQLIPVNIIAYRAQYGSVDPTAIVGPGILATLISTGAAVVFCKVKKWRESV